jgi:DNA replication and repair protein RecF
MPACRWSFDQRHVVLVGDNGAGKTNLMEAVSLLTPGRGMRRAPYGDLIKAGADPAPGFSIFASLEGMAGLSTSAPAWTAVRRAASRRCGSTARRRGPPTTCSIICGCCG